MIQNLNVSQSERLLSGIWNHQQYNLKNIENIGIRNQCCTRTSPTSVNLILSTAANELSYE